MSLLILVPIIVTLLGLLTYVLAANGKLVELGRIMFMVGLFVLLLALCPPGSTRLHP